MPDNNSEDILPKQGAAIFFQLFTDFSNIIEFLVYKSAAKVYFR